MNDVVIAGTCQIITTSGSCPSSSYSIADGVAHCRWKIYAYAARLVTPYRLWNGIGIHSYRNVICTSRFWILDTRFDTNMIVLQFSVNEATFEVLYNALIVTKTQLILLVVLICS